MLTDVLLITVTSVETKAALKTFGSGAKPSPRTIGDRVYFELDRLNGARVTLTRCEMGAAGLGASQQAVTKSIAALSPAVVIMVGIAFGIDDTKQNIGDILISERLRPYELQRVGTNSRRDPYQLIPRDDKPAASTRLLNLLRSSEVGWAGQALRFGTLLTGSKLVDNVNFRDQLRQLEPEAIGGEMEGGGLYVACHDQYTDWIVVKAICDFADGKKAHDKARRQRIAAANAASFVHHALSFAAADWSSYGVRSRGPVLSPRTDAPQPFRVTVGEETAEYHVRLTSLTFDVIKVEALTHELGVMGEYQFARAKYPRSKVLWQSVGQHKIGKGRTARRVWFDVLELKLAGGRKKQLWFDITSFFLDGATSRINPRKFIMTKLETLYLGGGADNAIGGAGPRMLPEKAAR